MTAVTLGLGARNLRDTDYFSKSDPFIVISKPTLSGNFEIIRTSETKKNTLNPDWKDFYFKTDEICNGDATLNIKFEIYDDDGKKGMDGKDKLIGQGFFSLKFLESAYNVHTKLPLMDGKNKKNRGSLVVRTFKYHDTNSGSSNHNPMRVGHIPSSDSFAYNQTSAGGYHQSNTTSSHYPQSGGYPSATSGYPSATSGYPGTTGYPGTGHPSSGMVGHHQQPGGSAYPGGHPGASGAYPPAHGAAGYPGAGAGARYPPTGGSGYPGQPTGYPPAPGGGSNQNIGGGGLFPDSHLPPGPGYH
eukprot:TRINITY_DN3062_c0_g1_i7.p1 TRINITY_DN3062_c0_g1~~TRINITY_DN3062_c0_g1_i7.p1  ORF type:complete len:301 (-),score=60.29 TRINITY_DN3062_c0_g1_i7:168-1070(-)